MLEIGQITKKEWNLLLSFFKTFFFTFRTFWKISNEVIKRVVAELYVSDKENRKRYHLLIANGLEKSENSVRKLEEQCSNYYNGEDYFMLKQTFASIEAFLLIFNPYTKFDLCRYWKKLEINGYDPVVEYNKGLESFNMHFSPSPQEIFTIILQISRFLKEFSDFETEATPQFRHPNIRGKVVFRTKKDTNQSQQDTKIDPNQYSITNFLQLDGEPSMLDQRAALPFKEDIADEYEQAEVQQQVPDPKKLSYLEDIGLEQEIKNMDMTSEKDVIKGHEKFNVDIPSGKDKFLQFFLDWLKQRRARRKLIPDDFGEYMFPEREVQIRTEEFQDMELPGMGRDEDELDNLDQLGRQIREIDLNIHEIPPPSYYYYKRWLWMTFPWVCLQTDQRFSFSSLISKCYSSTIRYLSVEEDQHLTEYAIKIVRRAKMKQRNILAAKRQAEEESNKLKKFEENLLQTLENEDRDIKNEAQGGKKPLPSIGSGKGSGLQAKPATQSKTSLVVKESPFKKHQQSKFGSGVRLAPINKSNLTVESEEVSSDLPDVERMAGEMEQDNFKFFRDLKGNKEKLELFMEESKKFNNETKKWEELEERRQRLAEGKAQANFSLLQPRDPFEESQWRQAAPLVRQEMKNSQKQILSQKKLFKNQEHELEKERKTLAPVKSVKSVLQRSTAQLQPKIPTIPAELRQRMLKDKSVRSLVELREEIQKVNLQNIQNLKKKEKEMRHEVDIVANSIRLKKKSAIKIQNTIDNIIGPDDSEVIELKARKLEHIQSRKHLEKKLHMLKSSKDRMDRIIEICELNQVQNEEWIRVSHFL